MAQCVGVHGLVEGHHFLQQGTVGRNALQILFDRQAAEAVRGDEDKVGVLQTFHVDFGETVQKGPRQSFSATALLQRVLGGKDSKTFRAIKRLVDFWNVDFRPVVQTRVQPFQHGLRG